MPSSYASLLNRVLPCLLVSVLLASFAHAQDVVRYAPKGRGTAEQDLQGLIEGEGPAGIQIKTREKVVLVPANDIVMVQYKHPDILSVDFRAATDRINQAMVASGPQMAEKLKQARDAADKLADKAGSAIPVARYAAWQVALSRYAEAKANNKETEALSLLDRAATATRGGWEEVQALRLLAEQQQLIGQNNLPTLERWAKIPGLPADATAKIANRIVLAKIREGKASQMAIELVPSASRDPAKAALLAVARTVEGPFDAAKFKQARMALATLSLLVEPGPGQADPALISGCLVVLGKYLLAQMKPEEALWQLVRVEAQFPQEKADVAESLQFLTTLYDSQLKNPRRAEECADRLRSREFSGVIQPKK